MEEKINIAKILKDKSEGTKLYSPICGECKLSYVESVKSEPQISTESDAFGAFYFWEDGKAYVEGECLLFPSKEMRDWGKFAWKKGDVLVCTDGKAEVIFERFDDDNYTSFVGKHYLESYGKDGDLLDYEQEHLCDTANYTKESDETVQCYINTIEKRLGGKLNRETLEIEKTQPEFKDGDMVFMKGIKSELFANCIFILKGEYKDGDERAFYYAFYNADDKFTEAEYGNTKVHYSLRSATDSEKQQLFDALAKKGKTWDAEKKAIVDLKPKCEFKPFDKVLSRRCSEDYWVLNFYSHKTDYYHVCIDGSSNLDCIPYNEETAHLLGTTDEWKGGKQ